MDQINSTVTYYPFGATRSGSVPTDRLFTGQRLDDTGLYFYNARYYEPGIGKFLSPDSASPDLYNPQSLNKYSYCFNNPLKYNDPSGKWPNWSNIGKAISKGFQTAVNVVKENMDVVHTVLDVAGMIPGVGEAFDAVNGVLYAAEGDFTNAGLSFASCIPVVGNAIGAVKITTAAVGIVSAGIGLAKGIEKVADIGLAADKTRIALTTARKLGNAGEIASGITKNTKHIESLTSTANYRIPDGLNYYTKTLSEVKNVRHLSYTSQIKDFHLYSQLHGYRFELFTRPSTTFSYTLQELIDNGTIILK